MKEPFPVAQFFGGIVVSGINSAIGGFAFMIVWNWFLPLIGVGVISFPLAVGLALVLEIVLGSNFPAAPGNYEGFAHVVWMGVWTCTIRCAVLVAFAWIWHQFAM